MRCFVCEWPQGLLTIGSSGIKNTPSAMEKNPFLITLAKVVHLVFVLVCLFVFSAELCYSFALLKELHHSTMTA